MISRSGRIWQGAPEKRHPCSRKTSKSGAKSGILSPGARSIRSKSRNHGEALQSAAAQDNLVAAPQPGMGLQTLVRTFGQTEIEGALDPPTSEHLFPGHGLYQAF